MSLQQKLATFEGKHETPQALCSVFALPGHRSRRSPRDSGTILPVFQSSYPTSVLEPRLASQSAHGERAKAPKNSCKRLLAVRARTTCIVGGLFWRYLRLADDSHRRHVLRQQQGPLLLLPSACRISSVVQRVGHKPDPFSPTSHEKNRLDGTKKN